MSRRVTVHLVRHAESLWNREERYQGQQDSGLTERGHQQASDFSVALARDVPRPHLVVSSDLARVVDTAAPYARAVGMTITADPRLREVDVGSWSGRRFSEVALDDPNTVAAVAAGEDLPRGGGETFGQARQRVSEALAELVAGLRATGGDATAVVFAHGGSIRVAAAEAVGLPSPGHARLGAPGNCSVTTLQWRGDRHSLLRYNHVLLVDSPVPVDRESDQGGLV